MSESADEHIASTIAAVKDGGRRWSALVDERRSAARAADRRTCLLVSLLCGMLALCSLAACALTVGTALRGNGIVVPIVVGMFGLSGAFPLYVVATAVAQTAVRVDGVLPARIRIAAAIIRSGQAVFLGSALGTGVAGVLVAVNGAPIAVIVGVVVGAVVAAAAALGRTLAGLFRRMAAA